MGGTPGLSGRLATSALGQQLSQMRETLEGAELDHYVAAPQQKDVKPEIGPTWKFSNSFFEWIFRILSD